MPRASAPIHMDHTSLLLTLAVILLGAKAGEAASRRLGLPPVLGEADGGQRNSRTGALLYSASRSRRS